MVIREGVLIGGVKVLLSFYKKYGRTAFDIGLIILTVFLIMFIFSYLYRIGKPIFFAIIIYFMIEPLAAFLHKKGLKKITASTISIIIFILIIVGTLVTVGVIFTTQINHLADAIPKYVDYLQENIIIQEKYISEKIEAIPPEWVDKAREGIVELVKKGSALFSNLSVFLQGVASYLTSISTFIINFIIGLILAYFLSIESDSWKRVTDEKTPNTFKQAYFFLKENVLKGIVLYLKAQLKLISFTFVIIFIGLLLLGINNAFSISVLAAVFDLLPLLGVSTVFIPWIIYLIIVGETFTAIWLAALWFIVIVFRQIAEPKITGDSLGVSAFTMLSFMVISLSLFGVAGIILSPVLLILIKALYDQGYLTKWIHLPEEEYNREG